jgi:hypothetical protein
MTTARERALYDVLQVIAIISAADGPLPDRVGMAYWSHLTETRFDGFPDDRRLEFERIQRDLKRLYPEPGKHEHVTYMQAFDLARRIVCAYDKLHTEENNFAASDA